MMTNGEAALIDGLVGTFLGLCLFGGIGFVVGGFLGVIIGTFANDPQIVGWEDGEDVRR